VDRDMGNEKEDVEVKPALLADTAKPEGWVPGRKHRASLNSQLVASLHLEDFTKGSWVVSVLKFTRKVDFDKLKKVLTERLLKVPRLRSKLIDRGFGRTVDFVELEQSKLDFDYLWKQAFVDKVASSEDTNKFIGGLLSGWEPRMDQPLWQITFIPEMETGNSCLLVNMSHILGDGVGLTELLYRVLDSNPNDVKRAKTMVKAKPPPLGMLAKSRVFLSGLVEGPIIIATPPDKKTTLRLKNINKPSATKACAFSQPIDIAKVKEVQALYQYATFNDVLVTLLNLTIRSYFEEVGDQTALKSKLRAQFPINMRSKKQGGFRGENPRNLWMYGYMPLFIDNKGSITDMFWQTKRALDRVKNSPAPYVGMAFGKLCMRVFPRKFANKLLLNVAGKSTVQLSNVAGPPEAVRIAGEEVEDLSFQLFAPLSIYVGLLTYNGKLTVSFNLDSSLADPELLIKHWLPAFEKLHIHATAEAAKQGGLIKQPRRGWF